MGGKMPVARTNTPPRPLAAAIRPESTTEIVGQLHLLGPGKPLQLMLASKDIKSMILWGPAGTGKTTIARTIAKDADADFYPLDATSAGVKELRTLIDGAWHAWERNSRRTIVFVDEIHRWSKVQQDTLLPAVEDGTIKLIGATTEKPQFAVNSTLLSRLLVFEVKPLVAADLVKVIARVIAHYKKKNINVAFDNNATIKTLLNRCSGDARKLVTVLELIVEAFANGEPITLEMVNGALPYKHIYFDASGNEHFDLAHCYQEAIQHSEGNDAIFWLAKWLSSGEDPVYISRRLLITAFEDCADNPHALMAAIGAFLVTRETGMPECQIPMGLATVVMAQSHRDKTGYYAIKDAMEDVNNGETVHVPEELRAGTSRYVRMINKEYIRKKITQLDGEQAADE